MIYVKIDRLNGAELDRRDLGNPNRALAKSVVWLPLVQEARPAHDPETEKLVKTRTLPAGLSNLAVPADPGAQVIDGWNLVTLTAPELADVKQTKLLALDQGVIGGVDDLVALAKAAGWAVPQALVDKVNARRALRGEPPL